MKNNSMYILGGVALVGVAYYLYNKNKPTTQTNSSGFANVTGATSLTSPSKVYTNPNITPGCSGTTYDSAGYVTRACMSCPNNMPIGCPPVGGTYSVSAQVFDPAQSLCGCTFLTTAPKPRNVSVKFDGGFSYGKSRKGRLHGFAR